MPEPRHLAGDKIKLLLSAVKMANEIPGSTILTFTRQGFMAGGLAAMRPLVAPIFAFTPLPETFRQMRLMRAVEPILLPFDSDPDNTINRAIGYLVRDGKLQAGDKLVIATDILSSNRLIDSIQLRTVR